MADEPTHAPGSSEPEAAPAPGRPSPLLATIANLLLPPLGHAYAGALGRGITLVLVLSAVSTLAIVLAVRVPTVATILLVYAAVAATQLLLPLDALLTARKRRGDLTWRRRPWAMYLLIACLVLAARVALQAVVKFEVRAFRIPSESMTPTLQIGDFLFAEMATYRARKPSRGDVIIFRYPVDPSKEFIHRVVALPNETVEVRNKQVYIDGLPLDETWAHHDDPETWPAERGPRDQFGPFRVPEGAVFVMGDRRDNANDSRFWGPLRIGAIRGHARVLYWSWNGAAPRWDRIGRRIE